MAAKRVTYKITPLRDRLVSHMEFDPVSGCCLWTGAIDLQGYGCIGIPRPGAERGDRWITNVAHRVAYEEFVGPIPRGLVLDHLCHKPGKCKGGPTCIHRRCINPAHLEPVTAGENVRRGCNSGDSIVMAGHRIKRSKAMPIYLAESYAIRRAITHCPQGHEYTTENTYTTAKGRACKECQRIRTRERRQRLRS